MGNAKRWPSCPACGEWALNDECENPVCPSRRDE